MNNTVLVLKDSNGKPVVPTLDVRREHAMDINIPRMPEIFDDGHYWELHATFHFDREYRGHWEDAILMLEKVFPRAAFSMGFDTFSMTVRVPKKSWDVDWELRTPWTAVHLCNPQSADVIHRGPLTPQKIAIATSEVMYGGDPKEVFRN